MTTEEQTCGQTGLRLIRSSPEAGWRLAKATYGPLNPVPRSADPTEVPQDWGRFDTRGGRTVYVAQTRECALSEMLAQFRRTLGDDSDPLEKDAAALGMGLAQFVASVEGEWDELGHMQPGHLPRLWRVQRMLYELTLPASGWWIDVEHADTMAVLAEQLGSLLADVGVSSFDRSIVLGPNRDATILIASWVREQVLEDGSYAHGITWESKHGTGRCWAYWLRRVDAGGNLAQEQLTARHSDGELLHEDDPDLQTVANRGGIRIW